MKHPFQLITRPVEFHRLCCVVVCDLETSRMGAPYIYDISRLRVKVFVKSINHIPPQDISFSPLDVLTQLNFVVVRIYVSDIMNIKFNIRFIDILMVRVGVNLLKPICYVMHHQFNIQQL